MVILQIFYFFLFFILWWILCGYFFYLYFFCKRKTSRQDDLLSDNRPKRFVVIVLSCNEKALIAKKIENLQKLVYADYEVWFVDASNDGTSDIISAAIAGLPGFRLIACEKCGRSYQLNAGLTAVNNCDYIMVTDVDSLIQSDTLQVIADSFADPSIGVVGGYVRPLTGYRLDSSFWNAHNAIKSMEAAYGYAPIVSGACYAFRRTIVDKIPEDVWADDIYVPLLAHLKGFDCVYSPFVAVEELRAPQSFKSFLSHKIRKSRDIIKELLRFLPFVFQMQPGWRVVYCTKIIQAALSPILIILFIFLALGEPFFVTIAMLVVLAVFCVIDKIFLRKTPLNINNTFIALQVFIITEWVLLAALVKQKEERR